MTTRPPPDLDTLDRLLDAASATATETHRRNEEARRIINRTRAFVRVHRELRALPSDVLVDELRRAQAAALYARTWGENHAVLWSAIGDHLRPGAGTVAAPRPGIVARLIAWFGRRVA